MRAALDGGGCVVAGAAGVGKSRLASEAVRGRLAIRVLATHSAAEVPYGAFAHLLPGPRERSTDVIPAFIQMLRDSFGGTLPVVVVDDGHLLDRASAALVLALSTTGAARPLVTVRTPEPVPDAITALWKDRGLERLDLQNLGRSDVGEMVRSELGGPVDARAVTRIADLTLGNPLYVRELLHDARATGALEEGKGGWRWREDVLAFDRLSVLIQRHVATVSEAARRALEYIAVVEHLPFDVLMDLASDEAVEELEREGLVRVATGPAAEVSVAHPLYGEVVASALPRSAGIRVRRRAAAALRGAGADPLQVAALLLDSGSTDPVVFLEASGIAVGRGGIRLGLRLARAAGESMEAALAVSAALIELARFDDVEPVLAPFESEASKAEIEVSVAYFERRCRALLRGSCPDELRAGLQARARGWHSGPEWEALLANENAWTALYEGRASEVLVGIGPFVQDERVSLRRRLQLGVAAMNASARLDRLDECLAWMEMTKRFAEMMEVPPSEARVGLMYAELLPKIRAGCDLPAIEATLTAARAKAAATGDRTLQTGVAMLLGTLHLRRGHAVDAISAFEEMAQALVEGDAMNNALIATTLRVDAYALHGDAAQAQSELTELDRLVQAQPRSARRYAVPVEMARAEVDAVSGRTTAAVNRFIVAAQAGFGDIAAEIAALYEALRLGADPRLVAGLLRPRVTGAQDALSALLLDHADALARANANAQLAAAHRFRELGHDLYAAEAASRAAQAFADEGRMSSSREAGALATKFAGPCGRVFSWALQQRTEGPPLTPREREIAVLAARGLMNNEIADALFVSVRTVESHLLNACQKLGVDNRHALASVIEP